MAESEKGPVSSANVKKKSASFDEDFGEDFLIPWKSSKLGKDAIDFDVGAVSRNGKKIYFNKLDDFELGGDFDKISSFKMDMSDLDLSSPLMKTEKPNETSCKELVLGKKEPRKENFSFTFDFNELSMFGLDPKLVTKEDEVSKPMDDARTDGSVKHDKDLLSRSNSVIKIDIVESDQMHTLPKKASMDTSRPTHLIEQDTVRSDDPSTSSNLSCDDMCCEAHISPDRHTPMTEENVEDKRFSEMHGKTADDSLPARQFSEKTAQDFSLLSVSCDDLVQSTLPNMHKVVSASEPGKANLGREQDNCMRSIASLQSRNSSPVNSYHSRGWQSAYKSESASISNEFQKDERNKRQIGRSGSLESTEHREDLANTSAREFSHGISRGTKNEGEKQNSNPKLLPSPLHREARQSDEQAENKNKGLLMSVNKPAKQGAPDVIRTESKNLSSSFHLQLSNLVGPTITSSTNRNLTHNIIPNRKFMKSSRSVSSELQGTSPKDGKQALLSSLAALRVRKLNGNNSSSGVQQGTKPKEVLEGNKGAPLRMISGVTNSAIKKHALLSPPLKRKTAEDSVPESDALNPMKFIMKCPTKRRMSPEIATRSTNEMVLGGETAEAFDIIPFNSSHENGSLLDFEVPILVENDENVEKAEACTRELDDICSMLKRKNEEAKELLVRAMVNNNALLMLNHPMFEEKIGVLQRFATSLRSKYSI